MPQPLAGAAVRKPSGAGLQAGAYNAAMSSADASPISKDPVKPSNFLRQIIEADLANGTHAQRRWGGSRSEEHTSELQSQSNLVCRLLLEKKKKKKRHTCTCGNTRTPRETRTIRPT